MAKIFYKNYLYFILGMILNVSVSAVTIQFDYRFDEANFFTNERRQVLEHAADYYESFQDSLLAIHPSQDNHWSLFFNNPGNLSSGFVQVEDLHVNKDIVYVFAGGSSMGLRTLGYGTTGIITSITGSEDFLHAALDRGQNNTVGANASDYGVWGGAISFNSDINWYFGEDAANLTRIQFDFLTTAVHELGHIFGYGTADSWDNQIQNGLFFGEFAQAVYGGPVPVSGAHWAEGVMSSVNGYPQETLMDPTTASGTREWMTDLDYAGLRDIGWQIAPVPLPPSLPLQALSLVGLVFLARFKLRNKTR
jgi:hypothetical protein